MSRFLPVTHVRNMTRGDALNRRVVSQRFVLRTLVGLGRSLTAAEYRSAKAQIRDQALLSRIEDPDAA